MRRRALLKLVAMAVAQRMSTAQTAPGRLARKVVLVTLGGIRRQESFSNDGLRYIPHLFNELLPRSLFYPYALNEGVTSHFNTISSVLTGIWQRVDDWGGQPPENPTLVHYLNKQLHLGPDQAWVVTSNKQLTQNIGIGANVILSKQLLIDAVERIILSQSSRRRLERGQILQELHTVMESDSERIDWGVATPSARLSSQLKDAFLAAVTEFMHSQEAASTADELTYFVACEVMRRTAPAFLMINFSDVEVAHNGAYSLHLAGIRRVDSLCYHLWQFLESSPAHRGRTTMVVMPEFGRDPDGSSTNGFFNHRSNTDTCRLGWMMVLGEAVRKPLVVERTIRQIDLTPSLGALYGVNCEQSAGRHLEELAV